MNDLDPYVCLFEVCSQPDILYKRIQPWLEHMRQEHMLQWRCPAKSHKPEIFHTRAEFEDHMRQCHHDTFSEKQLPLLTERIAWPNGPMFPSCPLCGLVETDIGCIESHVVRHLRFLALKSLPWSDDFEGTVSSKSLGKATIESTAKTRTTIREYFEQEPNMIFHQVLYDATERPGDKSKSHEEMNSLFDKSYWAMRTKEWGFLGGVFLAPSGDNNFLDISLDPILKAFAKRSTDLGGEYICLFAYLCNVYGSLNVNGRSKNDSAQSRKFVLT